MSIEIPARNNPFSVQFLNRALKCVHFTYYYGLSTFLLCCAHLFTTFTWIVTASTAIASNKHSRIADFLTCHLTVELIIHWGCIHIQSFNAFWLITWAWCNSDKCKTWNFHGTEVSSQSSGLWHSVVGYQHFGGLCSRWRQHGPLKWWYPTISLHHDFNSDKH